MFSNSLLCRALDELSYLWPIDDLLNVVRMDNYVIDCKHCMKNKRAECHLPNKARAGSIYLVSMKIRCIFVMFWGFSGGIFLSGTLDLEYSSSLLSSLLSIVIS